MLDRPPWLRRAFVLAVAVLCTGLPFVSPVGHAQIPTGAAAELEPFRRFWVKDSREYFSDWYAGRHRKMVPFGCTAAPYYDPDPRCARQHGFHHGLDIAMPCGTRLYAAFRTRVVRPGAPGALGSAYGAHAFRLRGLRFAKDFVIGHVRTVYVRPGQIVRRGQLIARASDAGAPDGCHLHFEVRPSGASYSHAIRPGSYLRLRVTRH
ncbi:MAG: M23 family metallopeptidase [Propionibacteriales bacterium]|nr:M23 family metallopeptidase [Propionibacteriales bacterium]